MRVAPLSEVIKKLEDLQFHFLAAMQQLSEKKPFITNVDIRNAPFEKCRHVIQSTYLSMVLLERSLNDDSWWKRNFPTLMSEEVQLLKTEYDQYHKLTFLHLMFFAIDSSIRVLSRTINITAAKSGTDNSQNVNSFVLNELHLNRYRGLLCIITLLRNAAHNNGRHTDATITLSFKGKPYLFEKDKEPEVYTWLGIIELMLEVKNLFVEIASSELLPQRMIEDENVIVIKQSYEENLNQPHDSTVNTKKGDLST